MWVVVTIAVGLLGGLFLVFEVSYRLGNRRKGRGECVPEQLAQGDAKFKFTLVGGPPNDPGLTFSK